MVGTSFLLDLTVLLSGWIVNISIDGIHLIIQVYWR